MLNNIKDALYWIDKSTIASAVITAAIMWAGGNLLKHIKIHKKRKTTEQKLIVTNKPVMLLPKLECKDPYEKPLIITPLVIKNPTKQVIKINHIRINEETPFELIGVMTLDPIFYGFSRNFPKYISFEKDSIKPQRSILHLKKTPLINPSLEQLLELFSLKSCSELSLTLFISPLSSNDIANPQFFIQHTAPYNPKKTIEVSFSPISFEGLETWKSLFEISG
ncbi:hypothetical protein NPX99_08160 [Bartonella sp. 220]|uniref:hypothetical protein n=1 Tax=Bartonella sp. 220B TaxID=2967260 RepID=UPI0022A8FE61|nr:hypothetical protein [Bartonella sp. 220B]MCZ2159214.1 hypothetical protein [Bartonella sp. 220B]